MWYGKVDVEIRQTGNCILTSCSCCFYTNEIFFLGNIFIIFCQHCNIFLPESEFFECGNEFLSHLIYIFPNGIVFEICDWNFIIKIPDGIYCRLCIFQDNNIDQRFLHKKKIHYYIYSFLLVLKMFLIYR